MAASLPLPAAELGVLRLLFFLGALWCALIC